MIRQIILISLLSFAFSSTSFSQKQRVKRKIHSQTIGVYLDNGSVIIGTLKRESKSELSLIIQGGDIASIPRYNIKRIKRTSDGYSFTKRGRYNYDKGMYCSIYPLVIFYGSRWPGDGPLSSGAGSQLMLGRHHNARLSYGLTTGVSTSDSYDEDTFHTYRFRAVPLAGFVNYNVNLKGPRLYLTSKLGHAFIIHESKWDKNTKLGLYGSFGVGIAMPSRYLSRFSMEVENTLIKTSGYSGTTISNGVETTYGNFSKVANYVTLKFGIALRQ